MNLIRIVPLFSVILLAIFASNSSGELFCLFCVISCAPGHKRTRDGICRAVLGTSEHGAPKPKSKFKPPKGAVFSLFQSPCLVGYERVNGNCRKIIFRNQKSTPGPH